ncbi:MAG: class I SAM-dependent methyltransferase, partial [Bdellovibrionia bacterium]
MIHSDVKTLLGLPEYAVDEYNITAMISYWPIIERLLKLFSPKAICEIGSERGLTTEKLLAYATEFGITLHSVDPSLDTRFKQTDYFAPHRVTSKEFLELGNEISFYLLDGDHNYSTVALELAACERNVNPGEPACILLHDVSWPWAFRDLYYSPTRVTNPKAHSYSTAIHLEDHEFSRSGFPNGNSYAMANEYGGPKNGVLQAVTDFIRNRRDWNYFQIPSLYGLGILTRTSGLSSEKRDEFNLLIDTLRWLSPFLSILEGNRLRLLQGLN